ncbi:unnamed protein product [Soboliphyme baturini]|uniref:ANK_REP_REGION domain-containing protein n=1 Tax=Soboliphyme baturini TaxID=241478 RepID=A0A183IED0_9BILA|nr:unnamed protein product [Soboliphyme baturini]
MTKASATVTGSDDDRGRRPSLQLGSFSSLAVEPPCFSQEIFECCRDGDLERVRKLVDRSTVNMRDFTGRRCTPLHIAADVNVCDESGLIPLHNGCSFGHVAVCTLLLKHRSNINAQDLWGYTPLHEAAMKGKVDVCILLLQNGADSALTNVDGKIALDIADPSTKAVLTGEYRKEDMLEAARSGNEELLLSLVTPFNVNVHASDGRMVFFNDSLLFRFTLSRVTLQYA